MRETWSMGRCHWRIRCNPSTCRWAVVVGEALRGRTLILYIVCLNPLQLCLWSLSSPYSRKLCYKLIVAHSFKGLEMGGMRMRDMLEVKGSRYGFLYCLICTLLVPITTSIEVGTLYSFQQLICFGLWGYGGEALEPLLPSAAAPIDRHSPRKMFQG